MPDRVGGSILAGEDGLRMQVKERSFQVSGGAFFQVNTPMAEVMVETLKENLSVSKDTTPDGPVLRGRIVQCLFCQRGQGSHRRGAVARRLSGLCYQPG